ncbi:MAG: lmo0937 family membrane protein, partial [Desulfomicrobium sp.]
TQWVLKIIQEKQVQYTDIIDLFQVQNVSKLYIQCNFFTDLGLIKSAEGTMLYTIAVVLLILWLLGIVSGYTIGSFIHILLVVAVIIILVNFIQGRRTL